MAERLAPEHAPLRIESRPERPRGRVGRTLRRMVATVLALALLLGAVVVTLHFLAIHGSAREIRSTTLVAPEQRASILVVLAHPGQEATMAGTLAALDDAGAQVHVLSLTGGEGRPPELATPDEQLAAIRADELASAGDVLGVDSVTVAGYADGELLTAEPGDVTATISEAVAELAPSTILTVSDLTGDDPDSQAVAGYALAAAQAEGSTVGRVWTVTRGEREVAWNAVIADPISGERVPEAQVAVRVDDHAAQKSRVLLAHGTQSPDLVHATYPYADRVPAWAYFRFWDREYFALAWGQPLE